MTLARLLLAGLLAAGTLGLAGLLLAALSDEARQATLDVTALEPPHDRAPDGAEPVSVVTCVVPTGFSDLSMVPAERRCSEQLRPPGGFEAAMVTEC
jgi:hypothetical protein